MPVGSLLFLLPFVFPGAPGGIPQDPAVASDAEARAEAEFEKIRSEILKARPQRPDDAALKAWLAEAGGMLEAFAKVHAGTGASFDARRDLALLVAQGEERFDQAIPLFEALLADLAADPKHRERRLQTLWLFANALKDEGRLKPARERAQELLDLVAGGEGEEAEQMAGAARRTLKEIDVAQNLQVGSAPLPFEGTGLDGKTITLAAFKGKVLLLDFWATWCGPCRREIPALKQAYADLHDRGFEILGISLDNADRDAFVDYLEKEKIEWPQVYDGKEWEAAVAQTYAVTSIPATFLLDRKGILRYRNLTGGALRKRVEELLAEN